MLHIDCLAVDAHDPDRLADFWGELLGWSVHREDGEAWIKDPAGRGPTLLFIDNDDPKTVKNRWHFDLRPDDQEAEVDRAISLGARRADIGQTGSESWVVLADPEGNEFCILAPKAPDD